MSRGISGGNQVIKFVNTRNRCRVCLWSQNETTSLVLQNEQFEYKFSITYSENIYGRY